MVESTCFCFFAQFHPLITSTSKVIGSGCFHHNKANSKPPNHGESLPASLTEQTSCTRPPIGWQALSVGGKQELPAKSGRACRPINVYSGMHAYSHNTGTHPGTICVITVLAACCFRMGTNTFSFFSPFSAP